MRIQPESFRRRRTQRGYRRRPLRGGPPMTAPAYAPPPLPAPESGGGADAAVARPITLRRGVGDRTFRGLARGSGAVVLAMMALVGGFLVLRGWQALRIDGGKFLTTQQW